MAARRGRSQARRNTGNGNGLPGWAWLVLGLLLGIGAILAAPRLLKSDGDGFFRPRPNPDAQPVGGASTDHDDAIVGDEDASRPAASVDEPKEPDFDFYTVLPGEEVAMTDAQLAATAREEAARQERQQRQQQTQQAAAQAGSAAAIAAANGTLPPPIAMDTAPSASTSSTTAATTAAAATTPGGARYILQAGAFSASGDAEELKARIALIGLGARVESASINGKTMYRVRMGPYGTASELAEAKTKLGSNGLPAMAIKAK